MEFDWRTISLHVDIVRKLLADPRTDPTAGDNIALRVAKQNGHEEVVKLLMLL